MKIAYFDCASGAAGDMILGALVDAGVPLEAVRAELAKLPLEGFELTAHEVTRGGFRATRVDVLVDDRARHPAHRTLRDVGAVLEGGALAPEVREDARRIFARLAAAEARAHGTTPEAVHFHDVGAVDAIADVVGAVAALRWAGIDRVHVSALPVGGGFVDGPHGRIPVPAPGTVELLRGFPVVDTGVPAELTTPTGVAILTTLAAGAGPMPSMTLEAVGYGAGSRDLPGIPNVLRCLLGHRAEGTAEEGTAEETVLAVETTIDDMSPQLYEPLLDRLVEAGALDVILHPVIMKRSRPGVVVSALCPPGRREAVAQVLFAESTTIGVRWSERRRVRLPRELVTLDTPWGPLTFKVSRLAGRPVTVTPEFAEVVRIARARGLPVREVLEGARAAGRRLLGDVAGQG